MASSKGSSSAASAPWELVPLRATTSGPRPLDVPWQPHPDFLASFVHSARRAGDPVVEVPAVLRKRFRTTERADRFIPLSYARDDMATPGVHVLAAAKGMGKSTCLRALCEQLPLCLFVTFSQSLAAQVCVELRENPRLDVYHYRHDADAVRAAGAPTVAPSAACVARARSLRGSDPPASRVLVVVINSLLKVGCARGCDMDRLSFDGVILDEFESDLSNVSPNGLVDKGRLRLLHRLARHCVQAKRVLIADAMLTPGTLAMADWIRVARGEKQAVFHHFTARPAGGRKGYLYRSAPSWL